MPGDQVKLSFDGMYRAVNKISGIFNPTIFKPTYFAGETKYEGTLGQYQKMDNATVTVTIPEDVTFARPPRSTPLPTAIPTAACMLLPTPSLSCIA